MSDLRNRGVRTSAHICGKHSRDVMAGVKVDLPLAGFQRIQINALEHLYSVPAMLNFAAGTPVIGQWRNGKSFPDADQGVEWLYDMSGGRGVVADSYPVNPLGDVLVGYSGGVKLSNIVGLNDQFSKLSKRYWIDMESGVRTDDDWMDLNTVERICAAIYG